jgi:TRAP-type C4-dicarboxylate transport system permease small subunit
VTELWATLRDPRVSTSLVFGAAVVAGLILLWQGWRGVAATLFVPFQTPYLVSGAVAGVAVAGTGLALLRVHLDRVEAAEERRRTAELQREVLRLLAAVVQA